MIDICVQSSPVFILKYYFLFQAYWKFPITNINLCRTHIKLGHQENNKLNHTVYSSELERQ